MQNNLKFRVSAYRPHETAICHSGRLGCWVEVEPESTFRRVGRWLGYSIQAVCLVGLAVSFMLLCAMA